MVFRTESGEEKTYEDYYTQAVLFSYASEILKNYIYIEQKDDIENFALLEIPRVVLMSFACELYLKTLLYHSKGSEVPHAHKLSELFFKIMPSYKDELSKLMGMEITELESKMTINGDAFVKWRYCFEFGDGTSIDSEFLNELCYSLRKIVDGLFKPEQLA